MSHPVSRFVVVVVIGGVVPWLALSATLAPEHIHEADDDHPQAIAHRHVAPHEIAPHDHDGAEVDHADGHIVWLDSLGAFQPGYHLPAPGAVLSNLFELAPAVARWVATSVDATAPPHGPPRLRPSLRAPPLSSR